MSRLKFTLQAAGIKSGSLANTSAAINQTIQGTVTDTGTAGRILVNALPYALGAGGAYAESDPLLYGAGVAALLETRTGARFMTGQGSAQRKMVELLRNRDLTRTQAEETIKQTASQIGRSAATGFSSRLYGKNE